MVASLAVAGAALRAGLRLRRARRLGPGSGMDARDRRAARRAHLRLAKPAVAMLLVGFVGGPLSAVWLRGWDAFQTAHAWVASTAAALFVATAVLGRRLEQGRSRAAERHALLALAATGVACAAFVTGFVLLP